MERVYTIPLRKAYRAQKTKRARKAVSHVRAFLQRHMKTDAVIVGESINEEVWKNGMARPPRRIKVHIEKTAEGVAKAEMVGVPIKKEKAEKAEKKASGKEEKKVEKKEAKEDATEEKKAPKKPKKSEAPAKKAKPMPEKKLPPSKKPEGNP